MEWKSLKTSSNHDMLSLFIDVCHSVRRRSKGMSTFLAELENITRRKLRDTGVAFEAELTATNEKLLLFTSLV
jgi:hypothetical protein